MTPGETFGHLTVLEVLPGAEAGRPKQGTQVRVRCVCGTRRIYPARRVAHGHLTSCGCMSPIRTRAVAYWPHRGGVGAPGGDLNTFAAMVDRLALALARAHGHRPQRRKKAVQPPPPRSVPTLWPRQFPTREAWLTWCARDEESERAEVTTDDLMHALRAA